MAAGEAILANVYLNLIPTLAGAQGVIAKAIVPEAEKAGEEAGKKSGKRFGSALSTGLKTIATGAMIGGALKGLYQVGATFDEVVDTIRTGTGATGKSLDGMVDVAKSVGAKIPAEFESVGVAVADINTRMGLSGDTLETVASQYLEAGRLLGTEVDIKSTSAAFNAFKIEGEGVVGAMDHLFQVSQATGVGMNELAAGVQKNAPALQELGFSFEESTVLIGQMDKAGLNSSQAMAAMSKGLVTLAKSGEDPQAAFKRVTSEIGGFIEKGDKAGALNLAAKVFGTRGATQFVSAIESGTLSMDDLMTAAGQTGDTILGVGADTADFAEKWQVVKNNALLALEPLGSTVFDALGSALGDLTPHLQSLAAWLGENPVALQVFAGVIGVTLVAAFFAWAGSIWAATGALLANPVTWIVVGIVALAAALVALIMNWDKVVAFLKGAWDKAVAGVVAGLTWLKTKAVEIFTAIGAWIDSKITGIKTAITSQIEAIKTGWSSGWGSVKSKAVEIWTAIGTLIGDKIAAVKTKIVDTLTGIRDRWVSGWEGIKSKGVEILAGFVTGAVAKVTDVKTKILDGVARIREGWERGWQGIKDAAAKIWDGIKAVFAKPINAVIGFVNKGVVGGYNWVAKKFNLKTLSPIPELAGYATGGYVDLPWSARKRDPYLGVTRGGNMFRFEGEEFIVNREQTRRHRGLLERLNAGKLDQHAAGGRVSYKGHSFTAPMVGSIKNAEAKSGVSFRISQGGFRPRTSYSGTSHQGDAIDMTPITTAIIKALRSSGIAAWDRTGKGAWSPHIHGVPLPGYGSAAGSGAWQAQDYLKGGDGLGGRDSGPSVAAGSAPKGLLEAIAAGFETVKGWFDSIVSKISAPFAEFTSAVGSGPLADLVRAVASELKAELTSWVKDKLGVGYAAGTSSAAPGAAWVGEHGPELLVFRGGEAVVPGYASGGAVKAAKATTTSKSSSASSKGILTQVAQYSAQGIVAGLSSYSAKVVAASKDLAKITGTNFGKSITAGLRKPSAKEISAAKAREKTGYYSAQVTKASKQLTAAKKSKKGVSAAEQHLAQVKADMAALKKADQALIKGTTMTGALTEKQWGALRDKVSTTIKRDWTKLTESAKTADTMMRQVIDQITKIKTPASNALVQLLDDQRRQLIDVINARDEIRQHLTAANEQLQEILREQDDFVRNMTSGLKDLSGILFGDVEVEVDGVTERVAKSAADMIDAARLQLITIRDFGTNVSKLKGMGVGDEILRAIANAGLEQGAATAAALVAGGKTAVKELTDLYKRIDSAAGGVAKQLGDHLYKAGIESAKGLIKGLQSKESELAKAAKALGDLIATEIKKSLKISSPSKVTYALGRFIPAGLRDGALAGLGWVSDAARQLAEAAIPVMSDPVAPVVSWVQDSTTQMRQVARAAVMPAHAAPAAGMLSEHGWPSELVVVDTDGQLITRMRVEAADQVERLVRRINQQGGGRR